MDKMELATAWKALTKLFEVVRVALRKLKRRTPVEECEFAILVFLARGGAVPLSANPNFAINWAKDILTNFDQEIKIKAAEEIMDHGWAEGPTPTPGVMAAQRITASGRERMQVLQKIRRNKRLG